MFKNLFKKKSFEQSLKEDAYKKAIAIQQEADKKPKPKVEPKKLVDVYDIKLLKSGYYSVLTALVGEQYENRQPNIEELKTGDELIASVGTFKGEPSIEILNGNKSIGWVPATTVKDLESLNPFILHFKVTNIKTYKNFLNVRGQLIYSSDAKGLIDNLG